MTTGDWIRKLRPRDEHLPDPVVNAELWYAAVDEIGPDAAAWGVEQALVLCRDAVDLLPYYDGTDFGVRLMRPIVESYVLGILLAVHRGAPPSSWPSREPGLQMVDNIQRRIPLEKMLAALQRGLNQLAHALETACEELVPEPDRAVQRERVFRIVFDFVNAEAVSLSTLYSIEERRRLAAAREDREGIVQAILAEEDVSLERAGAVLGYPLAEVAHVGFVFRQAPRADADAAALHRAASRTLRKTGASASLVLGMDRYEVWAWGAFSRESEIPGELIEPMPGGMIAFGTLQRGLDGFRTSHEEAQSGARLATFSVGATPAGRVVGFRDIQLLALLTNDIEAAARFMRDELGELLRDGEAFRVLRQTVRAYLECNSRPQDAARELLVARNTVVYRVNRAEELLGRSVRERQPELLTALRLAATIGPDAGTDAGSW